MAESLTSLKVKAANLEREAREKASKLEGAACFCEYICGVIDTLGDITKVESIRFEKKMMGLVQKEKDKILQEKSQTNDEYKKWHEEFGRLCDLDAAEKKRPKIDYPSEILEEFDKLEAFQDASYAAEAAYFQQEGVCLQIEKLIKKFQKLLAKTEDLSQKKQIEEIIALISGQADGEKEKCEALKKTYYDEEGKAYLKIMEAIDLANSFVKGRYKPTQKGE